MNLAAVEQIAKAVLYEGYLLYPYRRSSIKNQQRWNFGVLYPAAYAEAQSGADSSTSQTECIIAGSATPALELRVRFLQLVERTIGKFDPSIDEITSECQPVQVNHLEIDGKVFQPWQEAVERGTPALTVQAGRMSMPVLARLGFVKVGEARMYVDDVGAAESSAGLPSAG